jgi:heme O synthase-like polyprenyltransferase
MAVTSNQHLISDTDGLFEPSVADFWSLLKPRVMSLVIFTGFAGMYVAPGAMHPLVFVISLFAIAAGAGASGAINQWYDRDIDAVMTRTKTRPIPAGVMAPAEALTMGLVISALSVLLLGLAANWLAAGLLAFTIFFYAVVLHCLVKAQHAAKYRYRRGCWCLAASHRLGRGYRQLVNRAFAAFCDYLYVDAAAFLGFGVGKE